MVGLKPLFFSCILTQVLCSWPELKAPTLMWVKHHMRWCDIRSLVFSHTYWSKIAPTLPLHKALLHILDHKSISLTLKFPSYNQVLLMCTILSTQFSTNWLICLKLLTKHNSLNDFIFNKSKQCIL